MTQRIIYFTAAAKPTSGELLEIAGLNDAAAAKYEVLVRNKLNSNDYGSGPEECDFVAGDPPSAYSEVTVFDVDEEPIALGEDETVAVENSAASNTVDGTTVITDGVMKVVLDATDQIVSHGDTVVVKNSAGTVSKNGTATVASGAISGVALASTVALVTTADTFAGVTGSGTIATITITAGVISAIALSS